MTYYDVAIDPKTNDNFKIAEFRLWCPGDLKPAGVLAVLTGFNDDGRALAEDPNWQAFSRRHNLALLAYHMTAIWPAETLRNHLEDHYTHVIRGSGAAFWQAVENLGKQAGHPEMKDLPVAIWGHSAGGQFAYSLSCYYPERIIGFVSVKGGVYNSETSEETRRSVPGLIIAGGKDAQYRQDAIRAVFKTNRIRGALWCTAVEPNAGHGVEKSNDLALPFLDAVIAARMGSLHDKKLMKIKEETGWLGNLETGGVASFADYPADKNAAVWLPDSHIAAFWHKFQTAVD